MLAACGSNNGGFDGATAPSPDAGPANGSQVDTGLAGGTHDAGNVSLDVPVDGPSTTSGDAVSSCGTGTRACDVDASADTVGTCLTGHGTPLKLSGAVTTIAGSAGMPGSADGTGSAARFNYPYSVATDGTNLYVVDTYNHTIRKMVISTGAVTTIAGSAGISGSADGTGSAARFNLPNTIATDGANLYVADSGNSTIRKIVISTGVVPTIAGSAGVSGSTDGTGSAARFFRPSGIATDNTNLFLADYGNNTIRKIVISTGAVTTIVGSPGLPGSTDGMALLPASTILPASRLTEPICTSATP